MHAQQQMFKVFGRLWKESAAADFTYLSNA